MPFRDAWTPEKYLKRVIRCSVRAGEKPPLLPEESLEIGPGDGTLLVCDAHVSGRSDYLGYLYRDGWTGGDPPRTRWAYEGDFPMDLGEAAPDYLEEMYRRTHRIPLYERTTKRCLLRETSETDLDAFYEIYRDPSVTAYMEDLFPEREREEAYTASYRENIYEIYGFGIWTVIRRDTREIIGRAGISFRPGYEDPELGFVIGARWQRMGYAFEVCSEILTGARERGFDRVLALVQPYNAPSRTLCEKLGMGPAGEVTEDGRTFVKYVFDFGAPM